MKFLAVFIAFFGAAVAQTINIFAPKDGTTISSGPLTVTIDRPDTLTGSVEVALVLSIAPCPGGTCLDPSQRLGTTLYNGPFDPQFPPAGSGAPDTAPQQNFTVTIPSDLSGQKAILSAVHFSLVGASPQPLFEIKSVTVNVSD